MTLTNVILNKPANFVKCFGKFVRMVPLRRPKALTNAQSAEGYIGRTDFFTIVEHPPNFFIDEVGDLRGI